MAYGDLLWRYYGGDDGTDDGGDDAVMVRPRRFRDRGNVEDMRQAVQETAPETMGYGERFGRGLLHDVGDLGHALAAPLYYGAREVYRTAKDPAGQAAKYRDLVAKVAEDPYGTVQRVGGAVAQGLAEPYQRKEGEGFVDVVARNVLDRPLGTLMDASALLGIPAGAAERAGLEGAKVFADAARAMDPLTIAGKTAKGLMRTAAPDALARLEASREITNLAAAAKTRAIAEHNAFTEKSRAVFDELDDAEKALFFPYVEGRLKMANLGPEGIEAGLAELTPNGEWTPRGLNPDRLARLEAAKQRYMPILDEFETKMGYKPEQFAAAKVAEHQRGLVKQGIDPMSPEGQASTLDVHEKALQEGEERALERRTLSTRTSLNVQRQKQFQAEVERLKMTEGAEAAADYAARYPVKPATPEEAMQLWGTDNQGVYFPHSGEVFTRDQLTLGNLLTKVRESVPWKRNEGALYRTGALDTMDPEKALIRTHVALRGGIGRAEILDAIGQKFGERLEAGYKFGTDPDFRAGTHQLMRPGALHQEAALGEHMQDLLDTLLRHGDDPAVAAMDIGELTASAAKGLDTRYPVRADAPVYKIPKGVADAIGDFTRSLEPTTNPIAKWLDTAADPFNFVTLNLRPARILNNIIGNTTFQILQGVHPFSTTGIGAISDMVRAVAYKAGLSSSERGRQLAQVFDLPGVKTGGLSATGVESRTSQFLAEHPLGKLLGGKAISAYGETLARVNEHVENTARALSTLFELRKESPGLLARMSGTAKTTIDLGDRLTELKGLGAAALDDAGYARALKNVNRFLNDYGRTSAFERTVLRRVFPYHKFYKHSLELALRTPMEQPVKTALLRTIGKAAHQDFRETLEGWGFDPTAMVPPWMQSSVPIDVEDSGDGRGPHVRLVNLQGPSPFSLLSAAAEGDPGREGLSALHPAVKAALEVATGVNLFTMQPFQGPTSTFGGKEVDPHTGLVNQATVRPGPISQFTKQFFPVQIARDLVAGGRQPLDASSLLDMLGADFSGAEGAAYKVNERGEAIRRPHANPFARLFLPVPQTLEAPTKEQVRGQKSTVTEAYRKIGRARPDLQAKLRARRLAARAQRRAQEDEEGRPYRVKPRRE